MKAKKLIKLATEYLDVKSRKHKAKIKYIKKVLKKLSKREKELNLKLAKDNEIEDDGNKDNGNQDKVSNEIALIHAHRKKALKLLKQLEKERMEAKSK